MSPSLRIVFSALSIALCTSLTGACSDAALSNPIGADASGLPDGNSPSDPPDAVAPKDGGLVITPDADAGISCRAAKDQLLKPVDTVSVGTVAELQSAGTIATLYVDASAGGPMQAATNPRIYLSLATKKRVDVTDKTAETSLDWDLSLKRPIIFSNSGDAASGQGGAMFLPGKNLEDVTSADVAGATPKRESLFDDKCNPSLDPTGAAKTSFDGWYTYDAATNSLAPTLGTWIVRGARGALYRVQILGYYSNPDGTPGMAGGRYLLKVATVP